MSATGQGIGGAGLNNSYLALQEGDGTSGACPLVTGCLALSRAARPDLWSSSGFATDPKYGLTLPARLVRARELLRDRSIALVDSRDRIGYGLVDARQLAEALPRGGNGNGNGNGNGAGGGDALLWGLTGVGALMLVGAVITGARR